MSTSLCRAISSRLFAYLLMNVGAFAVVVALSEKGFGENIEDYRGMGYRAPFLGVMMGVFLFSLTGLPPTVGFAGKFLLFAALIQKGGTLLITLALIGVINSAISLYYYARGMKAMYFERGDSEAPVTIDGQHGAMLGLLALPILVFGIFWGPIQDWAQSSFQLWRQ